MYDEMKKDGGILIKQNYRGRCFLSFAIRDDKKEYYKSKLLEEIIFIVVDLYKFEFFKNQLYGFVGDVFAESFLKAVTLFDIEFDKEFIKKEVEFSSEILIDSLFYFKLQPLKFKWLKTAEIISQNKIVTSKASMFEIMKYLASVSDNLVVGVDVFISRKQIKLKNYCLSKCFKRDFDGISRFFAEMIRLNPNKINLKCNAEINENDEIYSAITKIFDDKIYVLN